MNAYIEPKGFKGTQGELTIEKEADRYLHISTPDGTAVASCYSEPMDEGVEYDAALFCQSKEMAKILQSAIEDEERKYQIEKESADWYNNNMPGVGQGSHQYKTYPSLPEWVWKAKIILINARLLT